MLSSHPDVAADPTLAAMLRSFIAGCETELHVVEAEQGDLADDESQLRRAFKDDTAGCDKLPDLILALERARLQFEDRADHFDEPGALAAIERIETLCARSGGLLSESTPATCRERMAELRAQCDAFRKQLDELARRAEEAARVGDDATAGWALRRMAAIHALRPALLPDDHYEHIRVRVEESADQIEHRAAARELVRRERAIAADIKTVAQIIRKFREVTRTVAVDDPVYRQAEREFREAAATVLSRDTDWMAGLLLELNELVDEIADQSGKAEHQVNYFMMSVRESLVTLRREIDTIQRRRSGQ